MSISLWRVSSQKIKSNSNLLFRETDNVLLSRYPIVSSDVYYYNLSPFTVWSVLYAEVEHPELGNIHTFCTHTVAKQPFVDLAEENLVETQELVSYINSKTSGIPDKKVFIMGDFNMSPDTREVNPSFHESYNYMVNNGFADTPYVFARRSGTNYECTLCEGNENRGLLAKDDYAIDHIFANQDSEVCVQSYNRFLTDKIVNVNGETVEVSDHYGVRVVFCASDIANGNEYLEENGDNPSSSVRLVASISTLVSLLYFSL